MIKTKDELNRIVKALEFYLNSNDDQISKELYVRLKRINDIAQVLKC